MGYFDELSNVTPYKAADPALGPQADQERGFFDALGALRSQRAAGVQQDTQTAALSAPAAPQAPVQPEQTQAPQEGPRDVGMGEAIAKGVAGTGVMMGSSAVKGVGINVADRIDPWLQKLSETSETAKQFIYMTGLGDETLAARQKARVAYTLGDAETPESEIRDTALLYQIGDWAEKGGYSMFGIDAAVQQDMTYKITSAVTQAAGMLVEFAAVGAVAGPAAAYAAVSAHGAMMELGGAYDNARMMGASHEEALPHAQRVSLAAGLLEAVSMAPVARMVGGVAKAGKLGAGAGAQALAKEAGQAPLTTAMHKALQKRGFNVRGRAGAVAAKVGGGIEAGVAEGAEEYFTGLYTDMDMKYLGQKWAPGKTWGDMLASPERAEEFFLGFVGGSSMGVLANNQVHFTEERKELAKMQVMQVTGRKGTPRDAIETDEYLQPIFYEAEARASEHIGKDMVQLSEVLRTLKNRAANSESFREDLMLTMEADVVAELYESAGVRAGRKVGMDYETARDAVRNVAVEEQAHEFTSAEEDAVVAQQMAESLKRHGMPALEALTEGFDATVSDLTGGQQKTAQAVKRVLDKVAKAQEFYDTTEAVEQEEIAADQEQAQMMQAVTADQLRRGAEARLDNLRRAWKNPDGRRRAIQILLSDITQDLSEADGTEIPASLYTSAMMDMPIGTDPANPNMTVREAMAQELSFLRESQELEEAEQIANETNELSKQQLQRQQLASKIERQQWQDYLDQLKMGQQMQEFNDKVEAHNISLMNDEQTQEFTQKRLDDKEAEYAQQQKEKAEKKKADAKEAAAAKSPAAKAAVQKKRSDENKARKAKEQEAKAKKRQEVKDKREAAKQKEADKKAATKQKAKDKQDNRVAATQKKADDKEQSIKDNPKVRIKVTPHQQKLLAKIFEGQVFDENRVRIEDGELLISDNKLVEDVKDALDEFDGTISDGARSQLEGALESATARKKRKTAKKTKKAAPKKKVRKGPVKKKTKKPAVKKSVTPKLLPPKIGTNQPFSIVAPDGGVRAVHRNTIKGQLPWRVTELYSDGLTPYGHTQHGTYNEALAAVGKIKGIDLSTATLYGSVSVKKSGSDIDTTDVKLVMVPAEGQDATKNVNPAQLIEALSTSGDAKFRPAFKALHHLMTLVGVDGFVPVVDFRKRGGAQKSLRFRSPDADKINVAMGYYDAQDHRVVIGADITTSADGSVELVFPSGALAHEMFHAFSTQLLHLADPAVQSDAILPPGVSEARAELVRLYELVKKRVGKDSGIYGLENVDEFVAEAFSNDSFQHLLGSIKSDTKGETATHSVWRQFKDTVFSLLGLNKEVRTVFDDVMEASTVLFETTARNSEAISQTMKSDFPDLNLVHMLETIHVAPPSQHQGQWAKATLPNGDQVEIRQGPHVIDKNTGLADKRKVTIRRRENGKFLPHEAKTVLVTTIAGWLGTSSGRPGTELHDLFGIAPPMRPKKPAEAAQVLEPLQINSRDPDAKKPWYAKWLGHFMRWGSQIEAAFGKMGAMLNKYGHDASQLSSHLKGTMKHNLEAAEEMARKMFPSSLSKSARASNQYKRFFGAMLGAFSIAEARKNLDNDQWGAINEELLKEMETLGFDPREAMYGKTDAAAAGALIKYAQTKAQEAENGSELEIYWRRYAEYVTNSLRRHGKEAAKGGLVLMHHLDNVGNPDLQFLLPPLMAARAMHDYAYNLREKHGLNNDEMADHTQNHNYQGLSADFFEMIKKNDPTFLAEVESAAKDVWIKLNSGKHDYLWTELGLDRNAPLSKIKEEVWIEVKDALANDSTSVFAKNSQKLSAIIRSRKGLHGPFVADWSQDASTNYMDKVGRDIALHRMMQEFWLTKVDADGNAILVSDANWKDAKERWFYHNKKPRIMERKSPDGTITYGVDSKVEDTIDEIIKHTDHLNSYKGAPLYNKSMISNYLLHTRGREPKTSVARLMSSLAKFQYVTKLGNFFTVITNMSVLFTLGAVLGPTRLWQTMAYAATNRKEAYQRAIKSGAVDSKADPFSEFLSDGVSSKDSKAKRGMKGLEAAMIWAFSGSETVIRTLTALTAEQFYKANLEVIADPEKAGIFKKLGISSVKEARRNLSDIMGFSATEIAEIEAGNLSTDRAEHFALKAMFRGSNEINFRHGGQFLPQMMARNNAISIFARVFKSFAYNVLAFQVKLFGKPLRDAVVEKDPAQAKIAFLRMAKVYGGATLTAQALNVVADMFKDDDDEDDLKGEGQIAKFAYNRVNDLNTVGMFGIMQNPYGVTDVVSFATGVHGRSLENLQGYGQEGLMTPAEEFFQGNFGDGFDQLMYANLKYLQKEITHVRMLGDAHRKYFRDRRDYDRARQVSRTLKMNGMTRTERVKYEKQSFQPSRFSMYRDKVTTALAEGRYGDAKLGAKEMVQKIMSTDDVPLSKALTRARSSVMMKSPLAEFSRTVDPFEADEQLIKFLTIHGEIKGRRDKEEAKRFTDAHLHYVRAVNVMFPAL